MKKDIILHRFLIAIHNHKVDMDRTLDKLKTVNISVMATFIESSFFKCYIISPDSLVFMLNYYIGNTHLYMQRPIIIKTAFSYAF